MYSEKNIRDYFSLPISYVNNKQVLNTDIVSDLELIETYDVSGKPIYHELFNPKEDISKETCKMWSEYYTDDLSFLKDSKSLYKNININTNTVDDPNKFSKTWFDIMNNEDFLTKYQFIDYKYLKSLNNNTKFLSYLSLYNITSPVLALISPIIILIIPFLILKLKKIPVTILEYKREINKILGKHAVGNFFKNFNKVGVKKKLYLLMSVAFYVFQMYQNCVSCRQFYNNQKYIHTFFDNTRTFIKNTLSYMDSYLLISKNLKSYNKFVVNLINHKKVLQNYYDELTKILKLQFNVKVYKNISQIGRTMKEFYRSKYDEELRGSLMYGLGFNGYCNNLHELKLLIKKKDVNFCKFSNSTLKLDGMIYPSLNTLDTAVKNNVNISKNFIITGPNAAGKTTVIKAAMLNVIFSQQLSLGFYDKATITPFRYLHCYINIPDTSSRDSLFQAEARRCKNIIQTIDDNPEHKHFCLFDELYSGTNPEEASASAFAFIDYLSRNSRVKFILTTHFVDMCERLEDNDNIINLHMLTNFENNKLLYKYKITNGISKVKGGLEVLKELQYPTKLINKANSFV